MTTDEVYQKLADYNEDELLYKNLFINKRNPDDYKKLLRSLKMDEINESQLLIPESLPSDCSPAGFNDDYFDSNIHKNIYLSKHNRYTPPFEHSHEFFEIIYVLSGECVNQIFGTETVMQTGDLCLMSPTVRHSLWTEEGLVINILIRRSTIQNVFFDLLQEHTIISDFFASSIYLENSASCLMFHTCGDKQIREQLLNMFKEQLEADEYSESIIRSMLMIFFCELVRRFKNTAEYPAAVKDQQESVSRILRCLLDDYANITLEKLAEQFGFSPTYCSRYVSKTTGCSFLELHQKIRFQRAEEYLSNTGMNIYEISLALGYENPGNFIRAFKKSYHCSPTQYRQLHKK